MSKNDGGSAFPCGFHPEGNSADQNGMTLRDYFAAKAMQGFAVSDNQTWVNGASGMAETCYVWADAMLAERIKDAKAE